ncbi:MAG: hypothetical protein IJG38_06805 [Thermoguttaceae bacterium]|nr:hypothetical protein [Thermoguttaceae bacterium]
MKPPSFFDILRRLLFWKSCPRPFQFGSVEAACVYDHSVDVACVYDHSVEVACVFVPTAEKQCVVKGIGNRE